GELGPRARKWLAFVARYAGDDETARLLDESARPRDFAVAAPLVQYLRQRKRYAGAARVQAATVRDSKDLATVQDYLTLAELHYLAGQLDEADRAGWQAVKKAPNDAAPWTVLAAVAYRGRRFAAAKEILEGLRKRGNLGPALEVQTRVRLALVRLELGEADE